jgi:apolipoprotein N-acyltransferase
MKLRDNPCLMAFASGALYRLSGPEWPLAPLAWIGLAIWAIAMREAREPGRRLLAALVFSGTGIISRAWWVFEMFDGEPRVLMIVSALSGVIVLVNWLAGTCLRYMSLRGCPMIVALPGVSCGSEFAAELFKQLTGHSLEIFLLPQTQWGWPAFQVADLGGGVLVTWCAAGLSGAFVDWRQQASGIQVTRSVMSRLVLGSLMFYGVARPGLLQCHPGPTVCSIAGPWLFEHTQTSPRCDIYVWPERALLGAFVEERTETKALREMATRLGACCIVGWERLEAAPVSWHNSAVVVGPDFDRVRFVDKHFPAPIRESEVRLFGRPLTDAAGDFFQPGSCLQSVVLQDCLQAGIGICYDSCFSEWARQAGPESDVLIVLGSEEFTRAEAAHAQ